MGGAWQVQDHIDRLADIADNQRGLDRSLESMSAVAEQRNKLQVTRFLCARQTVHAALLAACTVCLACICCCHMHEEALYAALHVRLGLLPEMVFFHVEWYLLQKSKTNFLRKQLLKTASQAECAH